jgi:hypothetical protein
LVSKRKRKEEYELRWKGGKERSGSKGKRRGSKGKEEEVKEKEEKEEKTTRGSSIFTVSGKMNDL